MIRPVLYVGNRNYSSWSLRPWLALRWAGIDFETRELRLDQPGYGAGRIAEVLAISPTGKVPALHAGPLRIWDSLAICEWAAEQASPGALWPVDPTARAVARAAAAEMHSGFANVRRELPMNNRRRTQHDAWSAETRDELARIDRLWSGLRGRFEAIGPYLVGTRSIADAMFTPVATRLRTYGVRLSPPADAYRDLLLSDAAFSEWESQCVADSWDISGFSTIDGLYR